MFGRKIRKQPALLGRIPAGDHVLSIVDVVALVVLIEQLDGKVLEVESKLIILRIRLAVNSFGFRVDGIDRRGRSSKPIISPRNEGFARGIRFEVELLTVRFFGLGRQLQTRNRHSEPNRDVFGFLDVGDRRSRESHQAQKQEIKSAKAS